MNPFCTTRLARFLIAAVGVWLTVPILPRHADGAAAATTLPAVPRSRATAQDDQTHVRLEQVDEGVEVWIDGSLFTVYRVTGDHDSPKPYCWPVFGPPGPNGEEPLPVTRAFPMEQLEGERQDHPHQRSWWFTHGNVNGIDFWAETPGHGTIRHVDFELLEVAGDRATIRTTNDWLAPDGTRVCRDTRELIFYDDAPQTPLPPGETGMGGGRVVDFNITITASDGDVTFGDTKEGSFGFRVATSMDVDSDPGGTITNSRGQTDADAWGQPAEWVDYVGPVAERDPHSGTGVSPVAGATRTLGIAIMNHPSSFRFPTHWHVRTYGLFAANPFGLRDFTGSAEVDGSYTIPSGDSITLRYRIYIHNGTTEEADVASRWEEYAGQS